MQGTIGRIVRMVAEWRKNEWKGRRYEVRKRIRYGNYEQGALRMFCANINVLCSMECPNGQKTISGFHKMGI